MTALRDTRETPGAIVDLHDRSFADMVERLFAEFDKQLGLNVIVQTARESREQLRGSPVGALPELIERLARHRLAELVDPHQT